MKKKIKTVGQHSTELYKKEPKAYDPIDVQREVHKGYEESVYDALDRGKKEYRGNLYVIVLLQREGYMQNVLRQRFFPRQSCPTPNYDQTVYRYNAKDDNLEFLWTIPAKETCELLYLNMLCLNPSERELLLFVLSFYDGSLLKKSKELNSENMSPLLI